MKEKIPVPVMVGAIIAFLAIVCFFGFRALGPDHSKDANTPTGPTAEEKARYEQMHNNVSGPGSAGHSSSSMPGYPGSGGAGSGGR